MFINILLVTFLLSYRVQHVSVTSTGEWISNSADTINPVKVVKRTIDDTLRKAGAITLGVAESVPVVGHVVAVVQLSLGNTKEASRALDSANSGTAAVAGGSLGLICGPYAVVCVPAFTIAAQTAMDGVNSLKNGEATGNIDYFSNLPNKSLVEHIVFAGGVAIDAATAGKGGKILKNNFGKLAKTDVDDKALKLVQKTNIDTAKKVEYRAGKTVDSSKDNLPRDPLVKLMNDGMLTDTIRHNGFELSQISVSYLKHHIDMVSTKCDVYKFKIDTENIYNMDFHSTTEFYSGIVIEFKPNVGVSTDASKLLVYHNPHVILLNSRMYDMKHGTNAAQTTAKYLGVYDDMFKWSNMDIVNIHSLMITSDSRSIKFPELLSYDARTLSNIQVTDLVDVNVGTTFDEIRSNCFRLSIANFLDIKYSTVNTLLPIHLQSDDLKHANLLISEYITRGTPMTVNDFTKVFDPLKKMYTYIDNSIDPGFHIQQHMINKNVKSCTGMVLVTKQSLREGHVVVLKASNIEGEYSHITIDYQVNSGINSNIDIDNARVSPSVKENLNDLDRITVGKRFKTLMELRSEGWDIAVILK